MLAIYIHLTLHITSIRSRQEGIISSNKMLDAYSIIKKYSSTNTFIIKKKPTYLSYSFYKNKISKLRSIDSCSNFQYSASKTYLFT